MGSFVASLLGAFLSTMGSWIIWLYFKRKKSFSVIQSEHNILSDFLGIIVLLFIGFIIYLFKR